MSAYCVSEEQLWSRKKWAPLRAWLLFLVQFLLHMFLSSLSSFLPPLLASCLHIRVPCSLPLKPPPPTSAPPPTPLCSGDSPEQRSAAAWQRASPVPSLSGDHQWDLHPCTCAKLAGGLPQSHTRHYGVCVASPIHLYLFPTLIRRISVVPVFVPLAITSRCSDSRPPLTLFEYVHAVISVSPNTDKCIYIWPFGIVSSGLQFKKKCSQLEHQVMEILETNLLSISCGAVFCFVPRHFHDRVWKMQASVFVCCGFKAGFSVFASSL